MKQFILYLLFCVIVATSTAGITVIVGQNDIKKNLGGETGTESGGTEDPPLTDEEKAMSALVASGTKLISNGINAKIDISVEANNVTTLAQIDLKAKINMDNIATSSFALGGETVLSGEKVQFSAIYKDLNVYVDIFGKKYKMTVRSIGTAISVISDLIGMDMGSSGIISGIDTSKLNELLKNITYKENIDKSVVIGFDLALSSIIQSDIVLPVSITVDADGDIVELSAKNIDINGMKISLNAELLKGDFDIKVDNKKDYESLDFAPELIDAAVNTANLKGFNLSGSLSISGVDVQINSLLVDVNTLNIKADVTVNGINVKLTYHEGTAYVDVFGKKFLITDENLLKTVETVLKLLNVQIPSVDTGSIKIGIAEIDKIFAQIDDISYVVTESGLEITLKAFGADVVLKIANGYISGVSLVYNDITADLSLNNPGEAVSIAQPDGKYMDLGFAPELIDAAVNTANLKGFNLSGSLSISGVDIQINSLLVDVNTLNIKADVTVNGINVKLTYHEGIAYVDVFGKKFLITDENLLKTVETVLKLINVQIPSVDTGSIKIGIAEIDKIFAQIDDISYVVTESGLEMTLKAFGADVVLKIANGYISGLSLVYNDITADLSLNNPGEAVSIAQPDGKYMDLGFAPELIDAAVNTANLKGFNLSGSLNISGVDIQINSLLVDVNTLNIKADVTVNGINVKLTYHEGIAYVDVFGKKFKINDENVLKTIETVLKLINVQIPSVDTGSLKIGIAEIEKIFAQIDDISYVVTESGLEIRLKAFGADVVLKIANGYISGVSLVYNGITADLSLNNPGEAVNIAQPDGSFMDFNFAPRLIDAVSKLINDRKFELQANITLEDGKNQVLGLNFDIFDFKLDISDFNNIMMTGQLNLTGDFALAGSVAFMNNTAFIDYDGFRAKMNLSAIMELLAVFGVQLDSQNLALPQIDADAIVKLLDYILDITYNQNTIGLILDGALFGTTGEIRLELILDENNNITNIIANDILSSIDGSRVGFNIKLVAHGESVSITPPDENAYMDFNCIPDVAKALLKTAELPAFDITSNFVVSQGGAPHLTANPQIVIDRANGLRVGGTVNVDLIDPNAVDYNAALWYESEWLYAKINQTAIQLNTNSIGDILSAVMSLMGQDMGSITGILDKISALDLEKVTKMVKSIDFIKGESANTVIITLDASILYEEFNMQTGTMSPDVVIELDINSEGYFSRLKVANVISALDQNVDFEILLNNIGKNVGDGEDDIKMPSRDGISFIDISGVATIITAVEKTGQRSFYKINGKLEIPLYNRDLALNINRTADNSIKLEIKCSYESGLIWKTQHENTIYFEAGGNFYYKIQDTYRGKVTTSYQTVTPAEFSGNVLKYINLLLEIGVLDTFGGSFGGNTIDWFNVLKGMRIVDLDGGSKRVETNLNIQELAGTTMLSGMNLNIEMNEKNEIYKLYISDLKLIGLFTASLNLNLDLGVAEGDAFAGFDISQYPKK